MTYKELSSKSAADLKKSEKELRLELFQLRIKHKTGQLEKLHQLKLVRKNIARIQMRLGELARESVKA